MNSINLSRSFEHLHTQMPSVIDCEPTSTVLLANAVPTVACPFDDHVFIPSIND